MNNIDRGKFASIFVNEGYRDYRWIEPEQIVVAQWVRFKCMFGCSSYGKKGTCPPHVPPVGECREFLTEYSHIAVIHFEMRFADPNERYEWSRRENRKLLDLEKKIFLEGYQKAFLLFMDECRLCNQCTGSRESCINKEGARPSPESLGIDVFATVRNIDYSIEVLSDFSQKMDRYAFLLID